jgi:hypothetical protein
MLRVPVDRELNRWDLHHDDILRHLGGLRPSQIKPVPPWRAVLIPTKSPTSSEIISPGDPR